MSSNQSDNDEAARGESARFDVKATAASFPPASTLLSDRYLTIRAAASARVFRVYKPAGKGGRIINRVAIIERGHLRNVPAHGLSYDFLHRGGEKEPLGEGGCPLVSGEGRIESTLTV
jgi:hypothetical protein